MTKRTETEDYEVGYRKPPRSGQFKEGVSGNPSGRPKKASDLGSELVREAHAPLIINENGKRKVIKKYQGLAKQLFSKALSGNIPAARLLAALLQSALEKAAAEQQRALNLANRSLDELTDEELTAVILAGPEASARIDKVRREVTKPSSSTDRDI